MIVRGVYELAAAAKSEPTVTAEQATAVASFLLDAKWAAAPGSASNIVAALVALADNAYAKPTFMYSDTNAVSATGSGDITVHLVDAAGKDVAASFAVKASVKGSKISGAPLSKSGNAYKLNVKDAGLARGLYEATFTLVSGGFLRMTDNRHLPRALLHTYSLCVHVHSSRAKPSGENNKYTESTAEVCLREEGRRRFAITDCLKSFPQLHPPSCNHTALSTRSR